MTGAESSWAGAHLRCDARRNLARIIPAAYAAFAEHGPDASVADIARRAEVGNATIFRRFPTKDDLIVAVIEERLREEIEAARVAAAGSDPLEALQGVVLAIVGAKMRDRGALDSLAHRCGSDPRLRGLYEQAAEIVSGVLERCRDAGVIRPDVVCQDLVFMVGAIALNSATFERASPGSWRRYVQLLMDALRPGGAPLDPAAPTWEQIQSAWAAGATTATPAATVAS